MFLKRLSITAWIFIALLIGIVLGVFFPEFSKDFAPVSNIFLRLIRSIVGPLLFGTLVYGISSSGELKTMGRIALKAVTYFEIATTLALVIGFLDGESDSAWSGVTLTGEAAAASRLGETCLLTSSSNTLFRPTFLSLWPKTMCCRWSCSSFCSVPRVRQSARRLSP